MIKIDKFTYRVQRNEVITLTVDLRGLGPSMVQVSDAMQPVPGQPLTWEMTIPATGAQEIFFVVVEVSFVQPPPGAKATIKLQGSAGGEIFTAPTITAASPIKDPDFSFRIQ